MLAKDFVTMGYLVTGDAQVTIAANYRMSLSVVDQIINETCNSIWSVLKDKGYIKPPQTSEEWEFVSTEFEKNGIFHMPWDQLMVNMWSYRLQVNQALLSLIKKSSKV